MSLTVVVSVVIGSRASRYFGALDLKSQGSLNIFIIYLSQLIITSSKKIVILLKNLFHGFKRILNR